MLKRVRRPLFIKIYRNSFIVTCIYENILSKKNFLISFTPQPAQVLSWNFRNIRVHPQLSQVVYTNQCLLLLPHLISKDINSPGLSPNFFLRSPRIDSKESIPPAYVAWARICKRVRRPGIDSEDSIPPAYVAWRAGTTKMGVVPARQAGNRFMGSLKGLQIRALAGR